MRAMLCRQAAPLSRNTSRAAALRGRALDCGGSLLDVLGNPNVRWGRSRRQGFPLSGRVPNHFPASSLPPLLLPSSFVQTDLQGLQDPSPAKRQKMPVPIVAKGALIGNVIRPPVPLAWPLPPFTPGVGCTPRPGSANHPRSGGQTSGGELPSRTTQSLRVSCPCGPPPPSNAEGLPSFYLSRA